MAPLATCSFCATPGYATSPESGPLLACAGLGVNFVHERCYSDKKDAGWCPDCCLSEKKAPTSKNIYVRVIQLMNIVLNLQDKVDRQEDTIVKLREQLAVDPQPKRLPRDRSDSALRPKPGEKVKTISQKPKLSVPVASACEVSAFPVDANAPVVAAVVPSGPSGLGRKSQPTGRKQKHRRSNSKDSTDKVASSKPVRQKPIVGTSSSSCPPRGRNSSFETGYRVCLSS